MIEVTGLRKSFEGREVLKGIDAVFEPGKINMIIGASGSGKTVTIKCMVGLIEPDHGDIRYSGRTVLGLHIKEKKKIRQEIGMLFQSAALFDSMTVAENVAFPLRMFTKQSEAEIRERVAFCLHRVELDHAGPKYPAEISGGMQKRVGIARAIALDIKYLYCDEPNSGLDPVTSLVIDHLIKEITEEYNITTIINTHDMNSIFEVGDHIMYLYQGQKLWEGSPTEIVESDIPELQDFIFASPFIRNAYQHKLKRK
ncbi:ATP-binding cassette domain-containing protein [bacterium]|nr:ATP-binding cassette domain-containing protein [bacterium]